VNAPTETGRPERRVDVIVGGDIAPPSGRSLSVGQLQLVLRAAHDQASHVALESEPRLPRQRSDQGGSQPEPAGRVGRDRTSLPTSGRYAVLSKVLGLQNLGRHLTARRARRTGSTPAAAPKVPGVWDFPRREWAGSFIGHARRWAVLATVAMLLVVGAVTVAGRVIAMVDPVPVLVAAAPRVSDVQFAGAAQAAVFDYLSWDAAAPRARRTTDLDRLGLKGAVNDGWDGSGRLMVENAVAVAVLRISEDQAVVTVQARAAASTPADAISGYTNAAGAPGPSADALWLTVAVPVALRGARIAPTAPPAVVGSPPTQALGPAVRAAGDEDSEAGRATADTVGKLIAAYGSGDLEFVRGPGSTFEGLAGMMTTGLVQSWRMARIGTADDPSLRIGDVTVLWTLPNGAGRLRSSYRLQLVQRENRWLLLQITPALDES